MSKCSVKCNEIKNKINTINGLDDDCVTDAIISIINNYADRNELNGTCFKGDKKDMSKVDKLLISHNIVPGYLGYDYIKTIIQSGFDIGVSNITSIYEEVANEYCTTISNVERAIRFIISKSNLPEHKNKLALSYLQIEYEGE